MQVLLVEDDFDLARALSTGLAPRGFAVHCCATAMEALQYVRKGAADVVVLDLGLPDMDGLEWLQRVRDGGSRVPVLVLTARGAVNERVEGLVRGADDYLPKPFDLEELVARLQALLRRHATDGRLVCGALQFDLASAVCLRHQRPLDLSARERALLRVLMTRAKQVLTKEQLHSVVFEDGEAAKAEAVEVLVHRLRKKITGAGVTLLTLRGVGYMLCEDRGEEPSP